MNEFRSKYIRSERNKGLRTALPFVYNAESNLLLPMGCQGCTGCANCPPGFTGATGCTGCSSGCTPGCFDLGCLTCQPCGVGYTGYTGPSCNSGCSDYTNGCTPLYSNPCLTCQPCGTGYTGFTGCPSCSTSPSCQIISSSPTPTIDKTGLIIGLLVGAIVLIILPFIMYFLGIKFVEDKPWVKIIVVLLMLLGLGLLIVDFLIWSGIIKV
jgi:hypothetical protein